MMNNTSIMEIHLLYEAWKENLEIVFRLSKLRNFPLSIIIQDSINNFFNENQELVSHLIIF